MRLLLDTHAWLWLFSQPQRLPALARAAVADPTNPRMWSTVCVWEIATKQALGKLSLPVSPADFVAVRMVETGASALPLTHGHALASAALPRHHGDPFDRLLVAQAQVDGLTLVTGDPQLSAYDVEILWA